MMNWNEIIITVLMSSSVIGFVQFMIQRHDRKKAEKVVLKSDCQRRGEKYEQYFASDKEKLEELSKVARVNTDALKLLIKSTDVMLEHMRTNNATGKIAKSQDEINKFLVGLIDDK